MKESLAQILYRLQLAEKQKAARRKCFISYYSGDQAEVEAFLEDFGDVFIPKVVGVTDGDDFIDSTDTDYVMSRIRANYLGDSTVTILLLGSCTHSRRYIDWELKTSLRQGAYEPNGLLGLTLPYKNGAAHLPPRFKENWQEKSAGYALYHSYPTSKEQLREWIEKAYSRRTTHAHLIKNSQEMHKYNRRCEIHQVTH
ncbi:MAG: TIR domain-containing protein [Rhodoluna sp.]|jgi:hypothetical protein